MEPTFQSSFIPKKPVTIIQTSGGSVSHSFNIVNLLATIFFVVTLLAAGGLFGYKIILNNQIAQASKDIEAARDAFQVDQIKDLIDANSRITAIKSLLEKHVVLSKVFTLLQDLTLKKVRFSDFNYQKNGDSPKITMKTEAQSYNALATQQDVFSKEELLKNPKFTNFATEDNGYIGADFYTEINPKLVSYKEAVTPADTTTQ